MYSYKTKLIMLYSFHFNEQGYNASMPDELKIVRLIQSTDRFEAYEASWNGQKVFAKKAITAKTRELLARVPENSLVADQIGAKANFHFRTPEVLASQPGWLVTEWIDGDSLAARIDSELDEVVDVLTRFMIVFDREPATDQEVRKTFQAGSLDDYMEQKLPKTLSDEQSRLVARAKSRFDGLAHTLKAAWQDGDIKPDHIFADPKNTGGYVLIDPEHFDPHWPRFYSLANNYVKYWVRRPKDLSRKLLKEFMRQSGLAEEEVFEPLLASIIVRCISLHWETDYDPGAHSYNIPRSQELLELILQAGSLDNLL